MHRREALKQIGAVAGSLAILGLPFAAPAETYYQRPRKFGTTFSQRQWDALRDADPNLQMDWTEAFEEVLTEGYDILRLGSYMDEHEADGGKRLRHMMDRSRDKQVPVRLVIGARQPRVPEVWVGKSISRRLNLKEIPGQVIGSDKRTEKEILAFSETIILAYRDYSNLLEWQVENEPKADLSFANHHVISEELFAEEVNLVNLLKRSHQLVCATSEFGIGNEASFNLALRFPDKIHKIGLDVYPKVPNDHGGYWIPNGSFWHDLELKRREGTERGMIVYIAEAQAELWENGVDIHTGKPFTESLNPGESLRLMNKLFTSGFQDEIDAWGSEYWKYQREIGNNEWHRLMVEGYAQGKAA